MNIRRGLQLWSTRQTRGSNMKLISIGFGNSVNADRIVAVVSPEAAPVKRIVQLAKDSGTAIDATCGTFSAATRTFLTGKSTPLSLCLLSCTSVSVSQIAQTSQC